MAESRSNIPYGLVLLALLAGCSERWQAVTPEAYAAAEKVCDGQQGLGWLVADSMYVGKQYRVRVTCRNGLRAEFISERRAEP